MYINRYLHPSTEPNVSRTIATVGNITVHSIGNSASLELITIMSIDCDYAINSWTSFADLQLLIVRTCWSDVLVSSSQWLVHMFWSRILQNRRKQRADSATTLCRPPVDLKHEYPNIFHWRTKHVQQFTNRVLCRAHETVSWISEYSSLANKARATVHESCVYMSCPWNGFIVHMTSLDRITQPFWNLTNRDCFDIAVSQHPYACRTKVEVGLLCSLGIWISVVIRHLFSFS